MLMRRFILLWSEVWSSKDAQLTPCWEQQERARVVELPREGCRHVKVDEEMRRSCFKLKSSLYTCANQKKILNNNRRKISTYVKLCWQTLSKRGLTNCKVIYQLLAMADMCCFLFCYLFCFEMKKYIFFERNTLFPFLIVHEIFHISGAEQIYIRINDSITQISLIYAQLHYLSVSILSKKYANSFFKVKHMKAE